MRKYHVMARKSGCLCHCTRVIFRKKNHVVGLVHQTIMNVPADTPPKRKFGENSEWNLGATWYVTHTSSRKFRTALRTSNVRFIFLLLFFVCTLWMDNFRLIRLKKGDFLAKTEREKKIVSVVGTSSSRELCDDHHTCTQGRSCYSFNRKKLKHTFMKIFISIMVSIAYLFTIPC